LFSSICQLAAGEVECYVCPEDKLSSTYGCGKLVSVNPKPPTKGDLYTVRDLEYKYCASKQGWSGCYKSESAITTSIECVCTGNRCNGAQRPGSQPFMLAAPALMLLAAVKAQLSA
uniref:Protein sleepless n=1 Tax=Macrostomum lignano TaxID=282301 RepID=A0A1I8FM12_9PLAT